MNGYDDDDVIILRTYNKIWKFDRKLYSIEGIKLLFPISSNEALYFSISVIISLLLAKFIPLYKNLHSVIKFIVVPYGIMKFLTKQKLDGKLPHKFFIDYIIYKISPKEYARFSSIDEYKSIKFSSKIVYREGVIVDKTERAVNKNKGRK